MGATSRNEDDGIDISGSSFNLTTALMILVMLLVVVVALLTYMLFEATGGVFDLSEQAATRMDSAITPTPKIDGSLNLEVLPPLQ